MNKYLAWCPELSHDLDKAIVIENISANQAACDWAEHYDARRAEEDGNYPIHQEMYSATVMVVEIQQFKVRGNWEYSYLADQVKS